MLGVHAQLRARQQQPERPGRGTRRAGPVGPACRCRAPATTRSWTTCSRTTAPGARSSCPTPTTGRRAPGGVVGVLGQGSCLFEEYGGRAAQQHLHPRRVLRESDERRFRGAQHPPRRADRLLLREHRDRRRRPDARTLPRAEVPACTGAAVPANINLSFFAQVLCDSQVSLFGGYAVLPAGSSYPRETEIDNGLHPLPPAGRLPSMPNPCAGSRPIRGARRQAGALSAGPPDRVLPGRVGGQPSAPETSATRSRTPLTCPLMSPVVIKLGSSIVADDRETCVPSARPHMRPGGRAPRSRGAARSSSRAARSRGGWARWVSRRPSCAVDELQAASAVGQGKLYHVYDELLAARGVPTRRCCSTFFDISARTHYLNARQTLRRLLAWRVVPVINENDTTTTDEISFGNNDFLAAQVAILLGAEQLLLLTDAPGYSPPTPGRPGGAAGTGGHRLRRARGARDRPQHLRPWDRAGCARRWWPRRWRRRPGSRP